MKQWLKSLPAPARNIVLVCGSMGSIFVLWLLLAIATYWVEGSSNAQDAKSVIERLRGYTEVEQELEVAVTGARSALSQVAYASSISADLASANLQRDLRDYARRAVLTVAGSQAMEEDTDESLPGFERLAVELSLNGAPLSIDLFLQRVYGHEPALLIESLNVVKPPKRARARGTARVAAEDKLNVRIVVSALREF